MERIQLTILILVFGAVCNAQDNEPIGPIIDELTYKWDSEAEVLNNYDGLTNFCVKAEYRTSIIDMLNDIHHYDSVLYKRLKAAYRINKNKEIEKTLDEIANFEKEYSMKNFIHFLHDECKARAELEKNVKDSKGDLGINSYDGQVYIIETELNKYIKHVTKRMDNIRDHVHHLHIE